MYNYTIKEYESFTYDDSVEFWIACEIHEMKQTERLVTTIKRVLG